MADSDDHIRDEENAWVVAKQRVVVIRTLLEPGSRRLGTAAVTVAAAKLGVSRANLYRLIAVFRTED